MSPHCASPDRPVPDIFPPVRSFVRRKGRLTNAQQRNLDTLWARYGLRVDAATAGALDLDAAFGRCTTTWLEIGFGSGEFLARQAVNHPEVNVLGVDVHLAGVGSLLGRLQAEERTNVRLFCADAVDVLRYCIPPQKLERVYILFPDPWPKQRHHKRRLIQSPFITLLATRMAAGGQLHLATDWEEYALQMMAVLSGAQGWRNPAGPGVFSSRLPDRLPTRFETKGLQLGHGVWDLTFVREEGPSPRDSGSELLLSLLTG